MSDEGRRTARRRRIAAGEEPDSVREELRTGRPEGGTDWPGSEQAYLRSLRGEWIYADGARLGWRGCLREVYCDSQGDVISLLVQPLYRVGEWDKSGPTPRHEGQLDGLLDRALLAQIGPQPKSWPRS